METWNVACSTVWYSVTQHRRHRLWSGVEIFIFKVISVIRKRVSITLSSRALYHVS